ncbi:uncharacterized protein METZ01_LOCUS349577, partial [marine metagenome]
DMRGVMDQGLCVFAPRQTVQHGNMCWSDLGAPVEIGSVTVKTGDLLHGDYGGCITVPEANHPWIVAAGSQVMDFEKQAHLELRRTDLRNHQKRKLMQEISAEHARRIAAIKAG